ncbi:MAG: hypothetical protein HEP71_33795 [Roseivirga sp.]|nr:hypothetical protein [Roseivirga sp.]
MKPIPVEAAQLDMILGEWTAVNKTMRRDGSGKYDVDDKLIIKAHKVLGKYGHSVDWYHTNGDYLGSTQRVYNQTEESWLSAWFDPQTGNWMDQISLKFKGKKLLYEDSVKDETGKFEVRREHVFSEDGKTYSYHHYRKYEGMTKWLLIDTFEAKRK